MASSTIFSAAFFGEDAGHENFCVSLVERIAAEVARPISIDIRSAHGGRPTLLHELKAFAADTAARSEIDAVVVATDANCKGRTKWDRKIRDMLGTLAIPAHRVVTLCPDPHIERWMLVDSAAFRSVFGRGCSAPDFKCEKDRYKERLVHEITQAGVEPSLGGMEFAPQLVREIDLEAAIGGDASLGAAIKDLRKCLA